MNELREDNNILEKIKEVIGKETSAASLTRLVGLDSANSRNVSRVKKLTEKFHKIRKCPSYLEGITDDTFKEIWLNSNSIRNVLVKISTIRNEEYKESGTRFKSVVKYANSLNLDQHHIKTTPWNKNLTIEEFSQSEPLENVLVKGSTYNSTRLKNRLIKDNILKEECILCGISQKWNDIPTVLQLDHIDGDRTNQQLDNLRILCGNCHSLTGTFCGKNKKTKKNKGAVLDMQEGYNINIPHVFNFEKSTCKYCNTRTENSLKVCSNILCRRKMYDESDKRKGYKNLCCKREYTKIYRLESLLQRDIYTENHLIRKRLFDEQIVIPRCSICSLVEWHGVPIPLELDHINGNRIDNRLENIRLLCPSCHDQQETSSSNNTIVDNLSEIRNNKEIRDKYKPSQICSEKCCYFNNEEIPLSFENKKLPVYSGVCSCGKKIHKNSKMCVGCYKQKQSSSIPNEKFFWSILEKENANFSNVGNYFGVSNTTVRKWCKKYYGITSSKEIKKLMEK